MKDHELTIVVVFVIDCEQLCTIEPKPSRREGKTGEISPSPENMFSDQYTAFITYLHNAKPFSDGPPYCDCYFFHKLSRKTFSFLKNTFHALLVG